MKQSKKFKPSKSVILFLICLVSSAAGFLQVESRDFRREESDIRFRQRDLRDSRSGLLNVLLNRNVAGERLTEDDSVLGNLYDMRSFRTGSIKSSRLIRNTRFDENNNLDRQRRSVQDENRRHDTTRRQDLFSQERVSSRRLSTDSDRSTNQYERRDSFRTTTGEVRRDLSRENRNDFQRDSERALNLRATSRESMERNLPEQRRSVQRETDRLEVSRISTRNTERRSVSRLFNNNIITRDVSKSFERHLSSDDSRSDTTRRDSRRQSLLRTLLSNTRERTNDVDRTHRNRDMSRSDSTRQERDQSSISSNTRRELSDRRIADILRGRNRVMDSSASDERRERTEHRDAIDQTRREIRDSTRQERDQSFSSHTRRELSGRRIADIFRGRNRVMDLSASDQRRARTERRDTIDRTGREIRESRDDTRRDTRALEDARFGDLSRQNPLYLFRRDTRDSRNNSDRRADSTRRETSVLDETRSRHSSRQHTAHRSRREVLDSRDTSDRRTDFARRETRDLEPTRYRDSIRLVRLSGRINVDRSRMFRARSLDRRNFSKFADLGDRRFSSSEERQHRTDSTRLLSRAPRSQELSRSDRVGAEERRDIRSLPDLTRMEQIEENSRDTRRDLSNANTERIDLTTSPKMDIFLYRSDDRRSSRSLMRESMSSRNAFAVPEMNEYSTDSKSAWVALANTAKIILSIYLIGQIFMDQSSKKTKLRFQNIISPLGLMKEKVQ